MDQKIIGCTPRIIVEGTTSKQFINDSYVEALKTINCIPILIPMDIDDLDIVLSKCDGFLITGGADITPSYFNQENNGSEDCNTRIDEIDKKIIEYGFKHKKPMLGICRGHQALNVFLGGDLVQDIGKSHQGGKMHKVYTIPNKYLPFDSEIMVNSYHHQIVDKLAKGIIAIGKSDEGYVEAFIHESAPIISVQWHPERMLDTKVGKTIFESYRKLLDKKL